MKVFLAELQYIFKEIVQVLVSGCSRSLLEGWSV